jgi:NAD(P)-dependent dehydrogenase (short-subunit alcohol dehydrogenase family)
VRGLAGRTAVVTGGAGGIGSAVAARLAEEGAAVRILDSAPARGDAAEWKVADVTDLEAMRRALHSWEPEVLVNVAGIYEPEEIPDGDSEAWERTIRVNLTGVRNCCAAAAPAMCERGFGRIVSISSNAAVVGFRAMPAYCASKAGVVGLTRALAVDLGRFGVTVNAVLPGSIAAGMGITSGWTSDPRMRAWDAARTPVPRVGSAEDIAGAVAFLASDDAGFITGQALVVDGGFSINGGPEVDMPGETAGA